MGEIEEVSGNDDFGASDDSRHGLQPGAGKDGARLPQANEQGGQIEHVGGGGDERASQLEEKVRGFVESLTEDEKAILAKSDDDELVATVVSAWSGMLPDPDSFSRYPEYAQRQMVAWNDHRIIGESKRLDNLTDASITQKTRAQWMTFLLNLVFAVLSFAAFVATGSLVSFGFLAIPGISIAFNIWKEKNPKDEDDG